MSKSNSAPKKILFQMSDSIACFKACALLSKLVQAGHEVEVVATASALKFVGEATLEGLTGKRVHKDTFESGGYMDHIHLMRWADLILLCPASANTLNKFANGLGDDLVSTMFLAHDFTKPLLIAPAMNQFMFSHPATQNSIAKLQSWGFEILGTGIGNLACGEVGEGRMLEPEQIMTRIEQVLSAEAQRPEQNSALRKILITSGGTDEPIDGVRSIKNTSTGRTGSALATWFADRGDEVTLIHAKGSVLPVAPTKMHTKSFTTFESLRSTLEETLRSTAFDAVIHLAAVADYSVKTVESNGAVHNAPLKEKIDSGEELTLRLKKNPKLIDTIRAQSKNPKVVVVGFKLTASDQNDVRARAIQALADHAKIDFIVHNDTSEITASNHPFNIYGSKPAAGLIASANGAIKLAQTLDDLLRTNQPDSVQHSEPLIRARLSPLPVGAP